jgi:hypothetical protein
MGQASRTLKIVSGGATGPILRGATTPVPVTPSAQLSQLPAQVNLSAYRGDSFSFTLTATNPADNSPVDFTGAIILAQIRSKPDDATIAATFTTSVALNVITLTLAATTSATLSGVFFWDCQITYVSGEVHTLAAGMLSMTLDISQ